MPPVKKPTSQIERISFLEAKIDSIFESIHELQKDVKDFIRELSDSVKNHENRLSRLETEHTACNANTLKNRNLEADVKNIGDKFRDIEKAKTYWRNIAAGVITAIIIACIAFVWTQAVQHSADDYKKLEQHEAYEQQNDIQYKKRLRR